MSIRSEGSDDSKTLVWGFRILESGQVWLSSDVELHWWLSSWNVVILNNFILLSILRRHISRFFSMMQVITLRRINSLVRWRFSLTAPISDPPDPWLARLHPLEPTPCSLLILRELMGPVPGGAEGSIARSLLTAVWLDAFLGGFGVCRSSCLVCIITGRRIKTLLFSRLCILLAFHNLMLGPYFPDLSFGRVFDMADWRSNCLAAVGADGSNRCHSLKAVSSIYVRLGLHYTFSRGWDQPIDIRINVVWFLLLSINRPLGVSWLYIRQKPINVYFSLQVWRMVINFGRARLYWGFCSFLFVNFFQSCLASQKFLFIWYFLVVV